MNHLVRGCTLAFSLALVTTLASAAPSPLATARRGHSTTLLANGQVLVAGGNGGAGSITSAELFDPATASWRPTGALSIARLAHTATLLRDGRVLVTGGFTVSGDNAGPAELYDPATGTWSPTGTLLTPRRGHTATVLNDGRVLIAGGPANAELYDPATGAFTPAGTLSVAHGEPTATLLASGEVLVAGGESPTRVYLRTAEVFDPATATWSLAGPLASGRTEHVAVRLGNGKVLVAGGHNSTGGALVAGAEIYDPATRSFSPAGALAAPRRAPAAVLLPNGRVVLAAGYSGDFPRGVELYDPATNGWSGGGTLDAGRYDFSAALLPSGRLLLAGGYDEVTPTLASVELYDPAIGGWSSAGTIRAGTYGSRPGVALADGRVLVTGGISTASGPSVVRASADLYDAATGAWAPTGPLLIARNTPSMTLLPSGRVLVAGGHDGSSYLASAELYDPATGTFAMTGAMTAARTMLGSFLTLLPDGRVLAAGGASTGDTFAASAELYDPATGLWSPAAPMAGARGYHSAVLLRSGRVLVVGGQSSTDILRSAELYDPASGTWSSAGVMQRRRLGPTATLLPNGQVLVAGGYGDDSLVAASELYDPATNSWSVGPSIDVGGGHCGTSETLRYFHSAALLASGKVLIAAGGGDCSPIASAELYDPLTRSFAPTGSLGTPRSYRPAVALLPNGQVLLAGGARGDIGISYDSAERYDEGRGAGAAPALAGPLGQAAPGATLTLTGAGFTGGSPGSGSGYRAATTNHPVVLLMRAENEDARFASVTAWSASSLTVTLPATLLPGWHFVRVIVNGTASTARALLVTASSDPCGGQTTRGTECGAGACEGNTGHETCSGGTWSGDTCDPLAGALRETCDDGIDDDCDGEVDEHCTPAERVGALSATVASLPPATGAPLAASLGAATASIASGNAVAAANQLNAFANKVRAQRGKKLTAAQADALLAEATAIQEQLLGG